MVGIIWLVQIVHYPLYDKVGASNFKGYEDAHVFRISFIVMPLMFVELITGGVILYDNIGGPLFPLAAIGAALLVIIWLSTFLVQARLHMRLMGGFSESIHKALVRSNWIRTAAWSLRGIIAGIMILGLYVG